MTARRFVILVAAAVVGGSPGCTGIEVGELPPPPSGAEVEIEPTTFAPRATFTPGQKWVRLYEEIDGEQMFRTRETIAILEVADDGRITAVDATKVFDDPSEPTGWGDKWYNNRELQLRGRKEPSYEARTGWVQTDVMVLKDLLNADMYLPHRRRPVRTGDTWSSGGTSQLVRVEEAGGHRIAVISHEVASTKATYYWSIDHAHPVAIDEIMVISPDRTIHKKTRISVTPTPPVVTPPEPAKSRTDVDRRPYVPRRDVVSSIPPELARSKLQPLLEQGMKYQPRAPGVTATIEVEPGALVLHITAAGEESERRGTWKSLRYSALSGSTNENEVVFRRLGLPEDTTIFILMMKNPEAAGADAVYAGVFLDQERFETALDALASLGVKEAQE